MIDPEKAYELEIAWCIGRIDSLIELAEAAYDRFGADDSDKWDVNGPLLLAIQTARADLTARCLEQHPTCICAPADKEIARLANAIAVRLGDEPRATWDVESLVALARNVIEP